VKPSSSLIAIASALKSPRSRRLTGVRIGALAVAVRLFFLLVFMVRVAGIKPPARAMGECPMLPKQRQR
jgi:hypothetical protein